MNNRTNILLLAGIILALASLLVPSPASANPTLAEIDFCDAFVELYEAQLEANWIGTPFSQTIEHCQGLPGGMDQVCRNTARMAYNVDADQAPYKRLYVETVREACLESI
jgi:hypothetical protein